MAAQLRIPRHRSRTEDLESSSLRVHLGLAWWKTNPMPQWARHMHNNLSTISEILKRRREKPNETSVRMVRVRTRDLHPEPNGYKGPGLQDRTPRCQERLGVAFGVLPHGGGGEGIFCSS